MTTWSVSDALSLWQGALTVAQQELRQRLRSPTVTVLGVLWLITMVAIVVWNTQLRAEGSGETMLAHLTFAAVVAQVCVGASWPCTSLPRSRSANLVAMFAATQLRVRHIVAGKLLAVCFGVGALGATLSPAMVYATVLSGVDAWRVVIALGWSTFLGVCAAGVSMGIAASARTFGAAVARVTVALAVSIVGTWWAYGAAVPAEVEAEVTVWSLDPNQSSVPPAPKDPVTADSAVPPECVVSTEKILTARSHPMWWVLAVNPLAVVVDAVPYPSSDADVTDDTERAYPLASLKQSLRSARVGGAEVVDRCTAASTVSEASLGSERGASPVWQQVGGLPLWPFAGVLWLGACSWGVWQAGRRLR